MEFHRNLFPLKVIEKIVALNASIVSVLTLSIECAAVAVSECWVLCNKRY